MAVEKETSKTERKERFYPLSSLASAGTGGSSGRRSDGLCGPWYPQGGRCSTPGGWWGSARSQAVPKGRCLSSNLPSGRRVLRRLRAIRETVCFSAGFGAEGAVLLAGEDASFLGGTAVRAQYFTPKDLTVVVVTHRRTEDPPPATKLPPPELQILPLPEEKPPLRIPPPTPQPPPMMFPPPTVHTPPPPTALPAPKPPALPPAMVVLPTTAAREGQTHWAAAAAWESSPNPRQRPFCRDWGVRVLTDIDVGRVVSAEPVWGKGRKL